MDSNLPDEQVAELLFEKDACIKRLIQENRGLRSVREALRDLIANEYPDVAYASVRGSVARLLARVKQLEELLEEEKILIPKWS